jgi:hypothetical protein
VQLDPGGRPYQGLDEGPPILDPFVRASLPPGPSGSMPPGGVPAARPTSAYATASLVSGIVALFLGPLASIAAVIFGVLGRRDTRPGPLGATASGRGRATAGLVLAALSTAMWAVAIGGAIHRFRDRLDGADAPVAAPAPPPGAAVPGPDPRGRDRNTGPDGTVPRETTVKVIGDITLVEVGHGESSLANALVVQAAAASSEGQKLLVTTASGDCEPCDGFVASLPDRLMQEALAKVRVVRVSIDVFSDELDGLRLQHDVQPGFFLLDFDLTPRDAIHGGEWGKDIAENIAPVLGPFLRGQLKQRKHHWPIPAAPRRNSSDPRRGGGIWL